jgi:hypothetical protein
MGGAIPPSKFFEDNMSNAASTLIYIAISFPLIALSGVVASDIWNWYVVPFFSASYMSPAQAAGFILLYSLATHKSSTKERTTEEETSLILQGVIYTLLVWGMAYFFTFFL